MAGRPGARERLDFYTAVVDARMMPILALAGQALDIRGGFVGPVISPDSDRAALAA